MNNWITTFSSVTGFSHKSGNIPCQDSCHVIQNDRWLSMVVSDGAGTAKYSEKGSALVTQSFAHALIDLGSEIESRPPGAWINDFVIEHILGIRKELRSIAKSDSISDYHCTLVACLLSDSGGFLIHIGDGAIFGGSATPDTNNNVSLSSNFFISSPENGEYSNETFFITEGDWIKHLRITPIGKIDWVLIATDGGTSLSMVDNKYPKPGFVMPLLKTLESEKDSNLRQEKLNKILADEQTNKLTSDDKTICLAFKSSIFDNADDFTMPDFVLKDQKQLKVSPTVSTRSVNKPSPEKYRKLRLIIVMVLGISFGFLGFLGINYLKDKLQTKQQVVAPKKQNNIAPTNPPHQV